MISPLLTGYEDVLKKREHEFRMNIDEMNSKVLEYELKVCWFITSCIGNSCFWLFEIL